MITGQTTTKPENGSLWWLVGLVMALVALLMAMEKVICTVPETRADPISVTADRVVPPPDECLRSYQEYKLTCDQPASCASGGESCRESGVRTALNLACAALRWGHTVRCVSTPDEGHAEQIRLRLAGAKRCVQAVAFHCGPEIGAAAMKKFRGVRDKTKATLIPTQESGSQASEERLRAALILLNQISPQDAKDLREFVAGLPPPEE